MTATTEQTATYGDASLFEYKFLLSLDKDSKLQMDIAMQGRSLRPKGISVTILFQKNRTCVPMKLKSILSLSNRHEVAYI